MYLLDTGVLLMLSNGKELGNRIDGAYGLRQSKDRPLVSVVSHGELRALARKNKVGERKQAALATLLDAMTTIDLDSEVIEAYAEVYEALRSHPKGSQTNIGENDMWIAATARATGSTLLTLDQHFVPLFGAVVTGFYIPR